MDDILGLLLGSHYSFSAVRPPNNLGLISERRGNGGDNHQASQKWRRWRVVWQLQARVVMQGVVGVVQGGLGNSSMRKQLCGRPIHQQPWLAWLFHWGDGEGKGPHSHGQRRRVRESASLCGQKKSRSKPQLCGMACVYVSWPCIRHITRERRNSWCIGVMHLIWNNPCTGGLNEGACVESWSLR